MTALAFLMATAYRPRPERPGSDQAACWIDYAAAAFIALELVAFHFGVS